MPNDQEKFIDQVTDGFGEDLEKKHNARVLLGAQLSDKEGAFEKANAQLEKSAKRPKWLSPVCNLVIVLLGLLFIIHSVYQTKNADAFSAMTVVSDPSELEHEFDFYVGDLSATERLLLFGDRSKGSNVERQKGLWLAEPENAGAYIEYLHAYHNEYEKYPEDMLQIAEKIDPDNAIYLLFLVTNLVDDCTEHIDSGRECFSFGCRYTYDVHITDEVRYGEVLELLNRALEMPKCTQYEKDMRARRVPLLQQYNDDWLSRGLPSLYLISKIQGVEALQQVDTLVRAEVLRCKQDQDADGLEKISENWIALCKHVSSLAEHLIDIMVVESIIQGSHIEFIEAAKVCNLVEMENYYTRFGQKLAAEQKERDDFVEATRDEYDIWKRKTGVLAFNAINFGQLPSYSINSEILGLDTRPERLADHAFWNRITLVAHWLLLLVIALITWVYSLCSGVSVKKAASKLVGIVGAKDWLFIIGVGVFLPIAIYWLVNGMRTELSSQSWYLGYKDRVLPAGQSSSLLLLLLFAPILAVTDRLQKALPLKERERMLMIWVAAGLALLSMPVFGLALVLDTDERVVIKLGYAMQAMSLLLLLIAPIIGVVMRQRKGEFGIIHHVRYRILVTIYVIASLVMVAQMPVYHMLEKHWVAQDENWKVSLENSSVTKYESIIGDHYFESLERILNELEAKP